MDSAGNAVDAFESDGAALMAFAALIRDDPTFAKDLALFAFGDDGRALGEPLVAADLLPEAVTETVIYSSGWTKLHETVGPTFVSWAEPVLTLTTFPANGLTVA